MYSLKIYNTSYSESDDVMQATMSVRFSSVAKSTSLWHMNSKHMSTTLVLSRTYHGSSMSSEVFDAVSISSSVVPLSLRSSLRHPGLSGGEVLTLGWPEVLELALRYQSLVRYSGLRYPLRSWLVVSISQGYIKSRCRSKLQFFGARLFFLAIALILMWLLEKYGI